MHCRWITATVLVAAVGTLVFPGVAAAEPAAHQPTAATPHTTKTLNVSWEREAYDYWCGPAATRIALSARMSNAPSQGTLASQLGTTVNGTDTIDQVTGVLNRDLGTSYYQTKQIPNDPPTQAQKDLLWSDVVTDVDKNYALVANIVAPPNNH
ncbi:MAG: C39 family peptidase, partial [Candidatus Dormibacteraceae bacterium]